MASTQLTNCKYVVGGFNLSGFSNSLDMAYAAEMLDDTRFGVAGTRSFRPGLKTFEVTVSGFIEYAGTPSPDDYLFNRIGAVREVMSFAGDGETEGDPAYTVRGVNGTYNPLSGEVGQLIPFEFSGRAANTPLVRGRTLAWGAKSGSGSGTGVQITPAPDATNRLYAALHVLDVGTNVVVTIESDDNAGFSSPTTRFTFATATASGAEWMELAGPVTDTYWRATWNPTGGAAAIWVVFGYL
jgi:hypothetical protein